MRIRDWSSDVCSSDLIGEFVRSGGTLNGTPLIDPATLVELFRGSDANPHYGLTWWLPRASAAGDPVTRSADIVEPADNLAPDLVVAAGAGDQRLYVIPSRPLTIVRRAEAGHVGKKCVSKCISRGSPES